MLSDTLNKKKIYNKGFDKYSKAKDAWQRNHPGRQFPQFNWNENTPGPDCADLSNYFKTRAELREYIDSADESLLHESAFRSKNGLYKILQTHEPNDRVDPETGIRQAAPLISDFSMMAVDLFQRTGKHEFVFMNPNQISHSPSSPNHLYQNYIIDILIPGIKDELDIRLPWYRDINDCIVKTSPKIVDYDASQIDYRDT